MSHKIYKDGAIQRSDLTANYEVGRDHSGQAGAWEVYYFEVWNPDLQRVEAWVAEKWDVAES